MQLTIENIQYHRNGVCGAPFHVLIFRDPDEGRMVGIVFEQACHVAVFNLDKLATSDIAFGVNSWRGDRYEPHLRKAIAPATQPLIEQHPINVHELLAKRRQIALVWSIEDVQVVRPDLSEEQAWMVLQAVDRQHDATLGVSYLTLECVAEGLFGPNHETDFA